MRRTLAFLLVAALVPVLTVAEPNARPDLDLGHPTRAVAISADGDWVLSGVTDQGSTTDVPSRANQVTWTLHQILPTAYHTRQDGGVDPPVCDGSQILEDDCNTPVVAVAIDADGSHFAVAGRATDTKAVIVFGLQDSGIKAKREITGQVRDLAISADGSRVVALIDRPGLGDGGRITAWNFGSTITEAWSKEFSADPTAMAMNAAGTWVAVAAGNDVRRYDSGGEVRLDATASTVRAIAVADDAEATVVAGMQNGNFRVYTSTNGDGDRELNIPGSGDISSLTVSADGLRVAVARQGGQLSLTSLLKSGGGVRFGQSLFQQDVGDTVNQVIFSGDREVMLLRQGSRLHMRALATGLPELWNQTLPATPTGVSMNHTGERIAVTHGSSLRLYETVRALDLQATAPAQLAPGRDHVIDVRVRNDGNRHERVLLSATVPTGFGQQWDNEEALVLPGAQAQFRLTLSIPSTHPPGDVEVRLRAERASGGEATRVLASTVPQTIAWNLTAATHPTSLPVHRGGSVDFQLVLRNDGNVQGQAPLDVEAVGAGWRAQLMSGTQQVPPGASETVTVRLTAPATAADLSEGRARVQVEGQAPIELLATVGASFGVHLQAPQNLRLEPGSERTVELTVRNDGNARDRFQLQLGQVPAGWTVAFDNGFSEMTTAHLAAGAEEKVGLKVTAPAQAGVPQSVVVSATSLADASATASRTILLEPVAPATDTDTGTGGQQGSAPAAALLAAALLGMAIWRRR